MYSKGPVMDLNSDPCLKSYIWDHTVRSDRVSDPDLDAGILVGSGF